MVINTKAVGVELLARTAPNSSDKPTAAIKQ